MTQSWSDIVGANIRFLRQERRWSAGELGNRCGLSRNVIENIELGRRRGGERTRDITVDELMIIAEALGIPAGTLLPKGAISLDAAGEHAALAEYDEGRKRLERYFRWRQQQENGS